MTKEYNSRIETTLYAICNQL